MPRPNKSVAEQLVELMNKNPAAFDRPAQHIADRLGRNLRTIKEHPFYRRVLAERHGVDLTGPEERALRVLATETTGGRSATADQLAAQAGLSPGLFRRRLRVLVDREYATSRSGDPAQAGYEVTAAGLKALRLTQPRKRKR